MTTWTVLGAMALLWLLACAWPVGPVVGQVWGSRVPRVETGLFSRGG